MRNKTVTKSQAAKLAKLRAQRDAGMNLVYGFAGNSHTVFSKCLEMASDDARATYRAACDAVSAFERELADDGRGWFSNGYFREYYR